MHERVFFENAQEALDEDEDAVIKLKDEILQLTLPNFDTISNSVTRNSHAQQGAPKAGLMRITVNMMGSNS